MSELKEILELQELEQKFIDDIIKYPYREFLGRTLPLTLDERNTKIKTIKTDMRTKVITKYIEINREREKANKPPLNVPYLRKENVK